MDEPDIQNTAARWYLWDELGMRKYWRWVGGDASDAMQLIEDREWLHRVGLETPRVEDLEIRIRQLRAGEVGGARIVDLFSEDYPAGLFDLRHPPAFIFQRGVRIQQHMPLLAVVGTRRVDAEGARITRWFVEAVVEAGFGVVSGGALGVDALAHRTCILKGGRTWVILPSALNRPTPRRHRDLFEKIIRTGGGVLSEYPAGTEARRYHFGRRNSLIAAVSTAVLVVRASTKSGTLLTAASAKALGRPIFVVPGSPVDPLSQGCLKLLEEGAKLASQPSGLVGDLNNLVGGLAPVRQSHGTGAEANLSPTAALVFQVLKEQGIGMHADEIGPRVQLLSRDVLVALLELELLGLVETHASGYLLR